MTAIQKIKKLILNHFFRDVMNSSTKIYLEYNRQPTKGINELHSIAKVRILELLENELNK
jgi:hypothetical protein